MKFALISTLAAVCLLVASPSAARNRDHLMCYKSKAAFSGTSTRLDDTAGLDVPGDSHAFFVKKPKSFCVPSDTEALSLRIDDTILDPNDAWVFYSTKRGAGHCTLATSLPCKKDEDCTGVGTCSLYLGKFDKKMPRHLSRLVTDGVVSMRLDFGKEIGVLAPSDFGPTAPPAGSDDYYACYAVKASKASCIGGSNDGGACKDGSACPGGSCAVNPKFPKEIFPPSGVVSLNADDRFSSPTVQQLKKLKMVCQASDRDDDEAVQPGTALLSYGSKQVSGAAFVPPSLQQASNAFDSSNFFEVKKPELYCNPACVEPFGDLIVRVTSLGIGANGQPGNGLDIDGDSMTCAPIGMCSGGVDNQLGFIAGLVNDALQETVADGGLNLIFELDSLSDGARVLGGYTGELAPFPGCTDVQDPNQLCSYFVDSSSLSTGGDCSVPANIQLPLTLAGAGSPPTATGSGGGPEAMFTISLPIGDSFLDVTAQSVKISSTLTHDGSDVSAVSGILGGALPLSRLRDALAAVDGSCVGGANDGDSCSEDSDCASSCCEFIPDCISPASLAGLVDSLLPTDIDLDGVKNCVHGNNDSDPCDTIDDCPDPDTAGVICTQKEALSLGLVFSAIDARISGIEP